ncbi:MAG TPA: hypothetical protein VLL54_19980 [Pyrinomonadaceae bacterium]|nr:hypothetical protein [Pyrinomonadaceae bacterium]
MPRYLYALVLSIALGLCLLVVAGHSKPSHAQKLTQTASAAKSETRATGSMRVIVTPVGPTQDAIDAAKASTLNRTEIQSLLTGTKNRLLQFELIPADSKNAGNNSANRFLATFYDYTNNRTVRLDGSVDSPGAAKVSTSNEQVAPSEEEFQAALKILEGDQIFGSALRAGELKAYPPMPPVLYPNKSGERVERTINIGVRPTGGSGFNHEIVGVNMIRETVIRYKKGAPPTSRATPDVCAIANSGQATTANGTAGQYQFTVLDTGGAELWSFLAIRPSASSGNASERSGIELRDVKYKGKSVLKRIHTPILNVNYDNDTCGPFRDWQYQEGMFQATGTDVPGTNGGVRDCGTNVATTALESGDDTGNFKGIAFYRETNPNQLVLVSEMNAGWYRYISEYGFGDDGTIRPRYGYGAVDNSCVCLDHYHHVYWRMDFDIGVGGNSITLGSATGRSLATEAKMFRLTSSRQLNFLITNPATGDGYMLRPNSNDGTANAFGMGDVWLLRFQGTAASPSELNDPNTDSRANIDAWVNGESIANQDIVIWYAGHFEHTHDGAFSERLFSAPLHLKGDHVQGPDLVPLQW